VGGGRGVLVGSLVGSGVAACCGPQAIKKKTVNPKNKMSRKHLNNFIVNMSISSNRIVAGLEFG
jgi:hypothetical protein